MSGAGTFKFRACTLPKGQRTRPKLARRVPPLRCSEVEPIPPAPERKASRIPSYDEDREVIHEAYLGAFQAAQPESVRIRGMQEFASAILARSRIPSQAYTDPLGHIFQEFDTDHDGCLAAPEVGAALRSRDVKITDEQVQMFIDVVDLEDSHKIQQKDFRELILSMAAADLHGRRAQAKGDWIRCTLESDDEIQDKLKGWVDTLLAHRQ